MSVQAGISAFAIDPEDLCEIKYPKEKHFFAVVVLGFQDQKKLPIVHHPINSDQGCVEFLVVEEPQTSDVIQHLEYEAVCIVGFDCARMLSIKGVNLFDPLYFHFCLPVHHPNEKQLSPKHL